MNLFLPAQLHKLLDKTYCKCMWYMKIKKFDNFVSFLFSVGFRKSLEAPRPLLDSAVPGISPFDINTQAAL